MKNLLQFLIILALVLEIMASKLCFSTNCEEHLNEDFPRNIIVTQANEKNNGTNMQTEKLMLEMKIGVISYSE